jgi:hypothetical protein
MEVKNQLQCVIGKKAKEYSVSQVITPMQWTNISLYQVFIIKHIHKTFQTLKQLEACLMFPVSLQVSWNHKSLPMQHNISVYSCFIKCVPILFLLH